MFIQKSFQELSLRELHDILKLRQDVFIVEQACIYPDLDGLDEESIHVIGVDTDTGGLLAYARILPPGLKYEEVAIGRVLTHPSARGTGLGRTLMIKCLEACRAHYPDHGVKISAQEYLEKFYLSLGFETTSAPYDDDGIMHIDMLLSSSHTTDKS